MFSKTAVKLEPLTHDLAKAYAAMPGLPGERPLRPSRLTFLEKHRQQGTFVSPNWAEAVDITTGQRYRVNGQHSSTMLARLAPEDFPQNLLVTIEEYTFDDLASDAVLIFDLFDNPQSARTNLDIMGLYRARYPDLAGIDLKILVDVTNGVWFYEHERGDQGVAFKPRERGLYLMRPEVRAFARWVTAGFADAKHKWMFGKVGIVAEMFASMQVPDKSVAEEFWRLVLTESHPDPDNETRELSDTLKGWVTRPKAPSQGRFRKEAKKCLRRFRVNQLNQMLSQLPATA